MLVTVVTFLRPLPVLIRLLGGMIFLLLLAGAWLPARWQEPLFYGLAQTMLVALATIGLLYQLRFHHPARAFIVRLALACLLWVGTEFVALFPEQWLPTGSAPVLEELGYFCVYLMLVWAVEKAERQFKYVSWLDSIAAPLFILGLSGYLLVIPLAIAAAEADTFLPSHLFYLFMDLYLLVRSLALLVQVEDGAWRQFFWLWLWALLGLTITDILDTAWFFDVFSTTYDDPWQGTYLLPIALFMGFSGWSAIYWRWQAPAAFPSWLKGALRREARIIGFTLLPLAIHFIGYRAAVFDDALRSAREWFLVFWLLGGYIVLQLYRQPPKAQVATDNSPQTLAPTTLDEPINSAVTAPEVLASEEPNEGEQLLLQKLDAVIEQHFGEPGFDVEAMATALAISSRQLQRRLKALADCSPADYLRRFRLVKAATLLKQGHKVAFVAATTGFAQQSHFGRCFKEMYGCTPGQFALNHKNGIE